MLNHWMPFHCQKAIFLCIAVLLSPVSLAGQKPYAPDKIQDVTIVSAEETFGDPGTLPSPDPRLMPKTVNQPSGNGCSSCGAELRSNAKFCTKCGAKA